MNDPRLNSAHLDDLPRRVEYRTKREGLLKARGMMTLASELLDPWLGGPADWKSLLFESGQPLPAGRFLLIDGDGARTYSLKTGLNAIGRSAHNDIVFEEGWVSRRHCVILVHATGGCELHDTASRNGTFINGQRVSEPVPLASGDRIQVCKRLSVFVNGNDVVPRPEQDDRPDTCSG